MAEQRDSRHRRSHGRQCRDRPRRGRRLRRHLDGAGRYHRLRRLRPTLQAPTARRLGSSFRVNSYTAGVQNYPVVAMDAQGDFVITWQSLNQVTDSATTTDANSYGVYAAAVLARRIADGRHQ